MNTRTTEDPICGMQVNPATARWQSASGGRNYHFCSKTCKAVFEAAPARYVPLIRATVRFPGDPRYPR